ISCSSKRNNEVGSCISTLVSNTNSLDTPSLSAVRLVADLARDSMALGAARGFSTGLLPVILACGACGGAGFGRALATGATTGVAGSTNAICGLTGLLPCSALG